MKRSIRSPEDIFGMADIRGRQVKIPHSLPFSFYFFLKEIVRMVFVLSQYLIQIGCI